MRGMIALVVVVAGLWTAAPVHAAAPGTATWLSRVGLNGAGSNDASAVFARPSADGSRVVFLTTATNLGDGASGAQTKAYLRDMRTGALTLVANDAYDIVISGDGRWIAFSTN